MGTACLVWCLVLDGLGFCTDGFGWFDGLVLVWFLGWVGVGWVGAGWVGAGGVGVGGVAVGGVGVGGVAGGRVGVGGVAVKGSNMIVCVLLVSNSRGCCLATPGDHEGAARVIAPRRDNTRGSLTPTIHTQSCLIPIIT